MASRPGKGAIITIAVLHLVGGGAGLFQSMCRGGNAFFLHQFASGNMPLPPGQPVPLELGVWSAAPGYVAMQIALAGFGLFFDLMLIILGIGLLMRGSWARWGSVGYAALSLLFKLIVIVYWIFAVVPTVRTLEVQEAAKHANNPQFAAHVKTEAMGLVYFQPCMLGALMIYPAVVILVMFLPSVGRYFGPERDDGRDFDDRDRGWRRDRDRDREEDDRPAPRIDNSGQIYRNNDDDERGRRRWGDDEDEPRGRRWRDDDR